MRDAWRAGLMSLVGPPSPPSLPESCLMTTSILITSLKEALEHRVVSGPSRARTSNDFLLLLFFLLLTSHSSCVPFGLQEKSAYSAVLPSCTSTFLQPDSVADFPRVALDTGLRSLLAEMAHRRSPCFVSPGAYAISSQQIIAQ